MKSRCIYSNHIPSMLDRVGIVVDDLIISLQNSYGQLVDDTVFEFKVILNEVLVNAILHGNHEDASKSVKIEAVLSENDEVYLVIEDEGCGYDFNDICRKHRSIADINNPEDMCENGRGIKIVQSLCDMVKVNKKGNKIVIIKKIANSAVRPE